MPNRLLCSVAGAVVAGAFGVGSASAALVTYDIVQAQSTLTLGGNLTGNTASQQTAGSLTTSYTGTIVANRTAGNIEFPGGSVIDAALQPTNQQPRADATPGSAPADYGRTAPGPFFSTALEAFRGMILDVFDDTSGLGSTVNASGQFASQNLILQIDSGESDVAYGNATAENDLSGRGTSNGATTASTVITSGGVETLTLRFNTGAIVYGVSQSGDSSITFNGTIVATRNVVIPEPTGLAALAAGSLLLARRRRA
ncbi:MAG TPA: hypothetical protein VGR35_16215 [Tepidisphaeraceae bacterium]|nr:hypothetical protein [Tepidisphaeraceae bacterium]